MSASLKDIAEVSKSAEDAKSEAARATSDVLINLFYHRVSQLENQLQQSLTEQCKLPEW